MRYYLIISFLVLLIGCNQKSEKSVGQYNTELTSVNINYDYMKFDSVLINCKVTNSINYQNVIKMLGNPDTIIKYSDDSEFYDTPYSLMKYKNISFHVYENGNARFDNMTFHKNESVLCYKNFHFSNSTTLNEISEIFPNSYIKRDEIIKNDEKLVAIRLDTSNQPTDSQWIFLFHEGRLKYFNYFDGND